MLRLKKERVLKDMSQRKLSQISGVDASYINRAERLGSRMYPSQEKKIMAALGLSGDASMLYEEVNNDD